MPSFSDVGDYLENHRLESHLSLCVALCVEEEEPQPLWALADAFGERAREAAVDFDFHALKAELRALVSDRPEHGPMLVLLSYQDAFVYSAALLPNGAPNAALRFADLGEGAFQQNAGLAAFAAEVLGPLRARHPRISHADLWAFAANVAIEVMGGPSVHTRFGRRDAASPSASERGDAEAIESPEGRFVDDRGGGEKRKAQHLRRVYSDKGLGDWELVCLMGSRTVGECTLLGATAADGSWTSEPLRFDNGYFAELLRHTFDPVPSASGGIIHKCDATGTVMTPIDLALLEDARLRQWVEIYASDPQRFDRDFAAAWARLQELGVPSGQLVVHPQSLSYASACYVPEQWMDLPLVTRRAVTRDVTIYGFKLPPGQALGLPVCGSLLLRAPGQGRTLREGDGGGAGGKDDTDAVRPYVPISADNLTGRFELLVRRYPNGAVSNYLHKLQIGSPVAFKHLRTNLRIQYPFDGFQTFTMLCTGTGLTACFQILVKMLSMPHDDRRVVLMDSHKSPEDLLLREELDDLQRQHPHRLTIVHVVGEAPDAKPPPGWQASDTYAAECGWIDEEKIRTHAFPPAHDTLAFVCGQPALYQRLCGPHDDKVLRDGTVLDKLGYRTANVAKL